jgi:hypothetical protein
MDLPHSRLSPQWRAVFWIVIIAAIAPFWITRFFPSQGLPQLLADVAVLLHFNEPEWDYQRFYRLQNILYGYWGFQLPVLLLSPIFSIETAGKIVLSLNAALIPLSLSYLLRVFGKDERAVLLAVPLIYNLPLHMGLHCFLMAIPFIVYSIAYWYLLFSSTEPLRQMKRQMVLAALMSFLAYVSHIFAVVPLFAMIGILLLLFPRRFAALVCISPVGAAAVFAAAARGSADAFRKIDSNSASPLSLRWIPLDESFKKLFTGVFLEHDLEFFNLHIIIFFFSIFLFAAAAAMNFRRRPSRRELIPAVLFLGMLTLYLAFPNAIGAAFQLTIRMRPLVCLLMITAAAPAVMSVRQSAVLCTFALAAASSSIAVETVRVFKFQERMAGFDRIIAESSRGGRTLYLPFDAGIDGPTTISALYCVDSYLQLHNGGDVTGSAAWKSNFHFGYLPGMAPDNSPPDYMPVYFEWAKHAPTFDRILVHGTVDDFKEFFDWAGAHLGGSEVPPYDQARLELRKLEAGAVKTVRSGSWTLYELKSRPSPAENNAL